jgi:transmembrane sensor
MDYSAYSTEDFLADESFQAFVFERDPTAVQFWQQWMVQHPAQAPDAKAAVALLQQLAGRRHPAPAPLPPTELAKLWDYMRAPVVPAHQPALRTGRRLRRAGYWVGGALVAVLAVLLLRLNWQRQSNQLAYTWYVAPAGGQQRVMLPDGSRVVLSARSALKLARGWQPGQPREVWLRGEGYFDVRHTAAPALKQVAGAPANVKFTVHAGPLDVAVLGTQFTVLSHDSLTKVVLNSGQIQLSRRADHGEQLLLKPDELAEYNAVRPTTPLTKRPVQAALYSAWTSGQLDFDNTSVADIIAVLQDTYNVRITVGNPALLRQKLTGSLPGHDLDGLLISFSKSLDVNYRRQGNRVWLD